MNNLARKLLCGVAVLVVGWSVAGPSWALTLQQAVTIAVESNPQIGQAIANREATEFELQQALGLYAPRLDLLASVGAERYDDEGRRAIDIQNDALTPTQAGLVASYDIFDSGARQAEANQQAARVDGASARVLERSEFIGLEVARQYFQVLLQQQVLQLAQDNVDFHQTTLSNVEAAIGNGQLTAADRQQAVERLDAARAQETNAKDALKNAQIAFNNLVGKPLAAASLPSHVPAKVLPPTLAAALGIARKKNPQLAMAQADVDAAAQVAQKSVAGLGPTLSLDGRAQFGNDINSEEGYTSDLQANLTLKWNIYDGGIQSAQVQENSRRQIEAVMAQQQADRDVEETVRTSWQMKQNQTELASEYRHQVDASDSLVSSYREQFRVGQRTLLDVLDAQNSRFNSQVLYQTAIYGGRFAEYRILASTDGLLAYLNIAPPKQSTIYARRLLNTPPSDAYEPRPLKKLDLNGPIDLTKLVN